MSIVVRDSRVARRLVALSVCREKPTARRSACEISRVYPRARAPRRVELVRYIGVKVQRRLASPCRLNGTTAPSEARARRRRSHSPGPSGPRRTGPERDFTFLLRRRQAGSLREPVLDFVHFAGGVAAPADGRGLAVAQQGDAAQCVVAGAGHLVRGEASEFVEEVLEIGAVQDEVLDLVDGAEGQIRDFFGRSMVLALRRGDWISRK